MTLEKNENYFELTDENDRASAIETQFNEDALEQASRRPMLYRQFPAICLLVCKWPCLQNLSWARTFTSMPYCHNHSVSPQPLQFQHEPPRTRFDGLGTVRPRPEGYSHGSTVGCGAIACLDR